MRGTLRAFSSECNVCNVAWRFFGRRMGVSSVSRQGALNVHLFLSVPFLRGTENPDEYPNNPRRAMIAMYPS